MLWICKKQEAGSYERKTDAKAAAKGGFVGNDAGASLRMRRTG